MKNKFKSLIFGAVWLILLCTGCTNSNEFSSLLPLYLSESKDITVTEITKTSGEYNIIVEIAPTCCSVDNIQQVYDSWEELFEDDEEKAQELYLKVPQPHYLIASHPQLTSIIEQMAENNYDGESNQGWIGVNIVLTDPKHEKSIEKSINEGTLGCFHSTEDMSGIKVCVK